MTRDQRIGVAFVLVGLSVLSLWILIFVTHTQLAKEVSELRLQVEQLQQLKR